MPESALPLTLSAYSTVVATALSAPLLVTVNTSSALAPSAPSATDDPLMASIGAASLSANASVVPNTVTPGNVAVTVMLSSPSYTRSSTGVSVKVAVASAAPAAMVIVKSSTTA